MRTAHLVLVAVLAAALPTTGCNFAVRGAEPSSATGGVGPDSDDPKLESPGSPSVPGTPSNGVDMTVVSAPPDLLAPRDLARPAPPPPPSAVGQPCTKDKDCGGNGLSCVTHVGGLGIFGADFPGGYCSQGCANDAACPAGSACRSIKLTNICVAQCPPSTCRSGYNCCGSDDEGVCAPATVCSAN
jgi:hypothetical protein